MFNYFKNTISKTSSKISSSLSSILSGAAANAPDSSQAKSALPAFLTHENLKLLEESLFKCDVGIVTARYLVDQVKEYPKRVELQRKSMELRRKMQMERRDSQEGSEENAPEEQPDYPQIPPLKTILRQEMIDLLNQPLKKKSVPDLFDNNYKKPVVLMICGVNGVGKTTTVAKLCHLAAKEKQQKTLLIAGDITRAAAVDQLQVWAERLGVPLAKGRNIPRVIHDVLLGRKTQDTTYVGISEPPHKNSLDLVILDTAGRLHNKVVQLNELGQYAYACHYIKRGAPEFRWLVLDASTGQTAVDQAKKFKEKANLNGIIVTKMDGTGKGGVVFRIAHELQLPVTYIGVGEGLEDLKPFNAEMFVDAILDEVDNTSSRESVVPVEQL